MSDYPSFCVYICMAIFCIPMFVVVLTLVTIPSMQYNESLTETSCTFEGSRLDNIDCEYLGKCWLGVEIFTFYFEGILRNDTIDATLPQETREEALRDLQNALADDHGGLIEGDIIDCFVDPNGRLAEKKLVWFDLTITIITGICALMSFCWMSCFVIICIGSYLCSFCERKPGSYEMVELD